MDFYYQIKAKYTGDDYSKSSNWSFPPVFSGKVSANNKKEAKSLIEKDYQRTFPLRVLKEDLESNDFLLNIEEMKENSQLYELFEEKTCEHCGKSFYVIDKYNNDNELDKGKNYCSSECRTNHKSVLINLYNNNFELTSEAKPIIYKITNKNTKMVYIGKTTQIFTLRWYQHFYQTGDSKFHSAIKNSPITDWMFEIVEAVDIPDNIRTFDEKNKFVLERERFWINNFNSINEGYNSI